MILSQPGPLIPLLHWDVPSSLRMQQKRGCFPASDKLVSQVIERLSESAIRYDFASENLLMGSFHNDYKTSSFISRLELGNGCKPRRLDRSEHHQATLPIDDDIGQHSSATTSLITSGLVGKT